MITVRDVRTGKVCQAEAEWRKVPPHNGQYYYTVNGQTYTSSDFWNRYTQEPETQQQAN